MQNAYVSLKINNCQKHNLVPQKKCGEVQFIFVSLHCIIYFQPLTSETKQKYYHLHSPYDLLPQVKHPDQRGEYGKNPPSDSVTLSQLLNPAVPQLSPLTEEVMILPTLPQ